MHHCAVEVAPVRAEPREDAEQVTQALRGEPIWGGMTERRIDCSGLVHMAHRRLGRLVPRDADRQEEGADLKRRRRFLLRL